MNSSAIVRSSADVDANPATFHPTEHRDQGQLDLFVDSLQLPAFDLRAQHVAQTRDLLHVVNQRVVAGLAEQRGPRVLDRFAEESSTPRRRVRSDH